MKKTYLLIAVAMLLFGVVSSAGVLDVPSAEAQMTLIVAGGGTPGGTPGGEPVYYYGGASATADGYTNIYNYGESVNVGSPITIPAGLGGTLTKIGIKIETATSNEFSCRVYDTSNNTVSGCANGTLSANGWNFATVASGPTLSAETTYRVICWTNGAAHIYYEGESGGFYAIDSYDNACEDPLTTGNDYEHAVSIEITP